MIKTVKVHHTNIKQYDKTKDPHILKRKEKWDYTYITIDDEIQYN